jgi:hypothetical protein
VVATFFGREFDSFGVVRVHRGDLSGRGEILCVLLLLVAHTNAAAYNTKEHDSANSSCNNHDELWVEGGTGFFLFLFLLLINSTRGASRTRVFKLEI